MLQIISSPTTFHANGFFQLNFGTILNVRAYISYKLNDLNAKMLIWTNINVRLDIYSILKITLIIPTFDR